MAKQWYKNPTSDHYAIKSYCQQEPTDVFATQSNGVADGPKPAESEVQSEQNPNELTENTKLWLGKDYSNFIRKDWVQLDKPFEGTSPSSAPHAQTQENYQLSFQIPGCGVVFKKLGNTRTNE